MYWTTHVEPSREEPGSWYWAFWIAGGVYADGVEATRDDAERKFESLLNCRNENTPGEPGGVSLFRPQARA